MASVENNIEELHYWQALKKSLKPLLSVLEK